MSALAAPTLAITLENVSVRYGRTLALEHVSGSFAAGSLTAIAGPNGAGKSTLLKAILGICPLAHGRIVVAPQMRLAYLPQADAVRRDFPINVAQFCATGFWPTHGHHRALAPLEHSKITTALAAVGLGALAERPIAELSGGQWQRLLFARVLVQDAEIILLDEPFASVDAATTAQLIELLLGWHRAGRTIICVLHDLLLIQKYFPDSFVLAGKCLGHGHTHTMLEQKLLSFELDMAELCAGPDSQSHARHAESTKPHVHGPHCNHSHPPQPKARDHA